MPKIFIIACEASGDLHGAHLAQELLKQKPDTELQGIGGPLMASSGVKLHEDMTKMSALGLGDVLRQYFKYREIFYRTLRKIEEFKPDGIVMIDSPAFNLRLAKKIKKRFPVFYYISPQLWAWGGQRIHDVKKTVTKMLVILPFEKNMYEQAGVPVEFVGHPLLDHMHTKAERETLRPELGIGAGETAIGLFPGSRRREVDRIFPAMVQAAALIKKEIPTASFYTVRSANLPEEPFDAVLNANPGVTVTILKNREGLYRDAVAAMDFALITSGTATLEAGLIGTPYFLMYRASTTTYILGRWLVQVPFLGLVNLLAGKSVVPEFIQDLDPERIAKQAVKLLQDPKACAEMKKEFAEVRNKLGDAGASRRAAEAVLNSLR